MSGWMGGQALSGPNPWNPIQTRCWIRGTAHSTSTTNTPSIQTKETTTMSNETTNNDDTIQVQLTITAADGAPRIPLKIPKTITASELLESAKTETKIPNLKLIYRGRLIKSADDISAVPEYKLEEGSVLHCMGKPMEAATTAATATTASTVAPTTTLPSVTLGTPPNTSVTASAPVSAATTTTPTSLTGALASFKAQNPPATYQTGLTTLHKLLTNIIQHPLDDKYRKVKRSNAAFGRRLGNLPGASAVLLACGFIVNAEDQYELEATEESWNQLLANERTISGMMAATTAPSLPGMPAGMPNLPGMPAGIPNLPGMPAGFPNLPGMPPMGPDGMPDPAAMNSPEMQAMVQQLLSNPSQVQAMLQVRVYILRIQEFKLTIRRIPWSKTCCVRIHDLPTIPWPKKPWRRCKTIPKPLRK